MACMCEERKLYKVWWESPKERVHSEEHGINGWMGFECILRETGWRGVGSGFTWPRFGTHGRLL